MPALPPNFLDELRARTPIQPLIGRTVRLTRSGREQKGCCPFHGEKTPSFYVYDDHYHCFGCGEHGDVITWVMKAEGASFMEAVESLSREAGLEIPKATPQAAEAEQKRAGIAETLEAAAAVYQRWLFAEQGRPALDYLRNRGLSDDTIRKFGLGWSGEGRGALAAALRGQDIKPDQLIEAGLMKQGDSGPVDMFFSRVMFPITDRRGTKISFSGRILGDGQPKYVNGPETAVFSKRRSLYGLSLARDPVRKGAPLILVEGQMDVIALSQAGFPGAVAPLGTALTEEQLAECWLLSPIPHVCFDADRAGRAAAQKAAELALPHLKQDQMLAFIGLPDKEDPDSVVRKRGPTAFNGLIQKSLPIAQVLFDFAAAGANPKTSVGLLKIKGKINEILAAVKDDKVKKAFSESFSDRLWNLRKSQNGRNRINVRLEKEVYGSGVPPIDASGKEANEKRCQIMTRFLLDHPEIFPDIEEAFAHLPLPPACCRLRDALHGYAADATTLDSASLLTHLRELGLAEEAHTLGALTAEDYRPEPELSPADAAKTWWSWYILMDFSIDTLRQQRDEQQQFWSAHQDDEAAWARLVKYNDLLRQAQAGEYGAET